MPNHQLLNYLCGSEHLESNSSTSQYDYITTKFIEKMINVLTKLYQITKQFDSTGLYVTKIAGLSDDSKSAHLIFSSHASR